MKKKVKDFPTFCRVIFRIPTISAEPERKVSKKCRFSAKENRSKIKLSHPYIFPTDVENADSMIQKRFIKHKKHL